MKQRKAIPKLRSIINWDLCGSIPVGCLIEILSGIDEMVKMEEASELLQQ